MMTPEQIQARIESLQKAKQMWMSDDFKDSDWSVVVTHINMHIDDLKVFLNEKAGDALVLIPTR